MPMLPFLALTAAIPAVGNARNAIACFRERLKERVVFGTDAKQADKPAAQMRLAMADMQTRTAELLIRDVARTLMTFGQRGRPAEPAERISLRAQIASRDALEEARSIGDLEVLLQEVTHRRTSMLGELAQLLDERGDPAAAAEVVRALMFVERFGEEVDRRFDALGQ